MMGSWEACVDYMTPLGLHHIMAANNHYGPQPNYVSPVRNDWSSTYYHKADANGIGFDRSSKGSNAVSQYHPPLNELWNNPKTCPEKYMLWFHHLPWDYKLISGQTLWERLKIHYQGGVDYVTFMQKQWASLKDKIDPQRFEEVQSRLNLQKENAVLWRDTCLKYFSRFAEKNINGVKK